MKMSGNGRNRLSMGLFSVLTSLILLATLIFVNLTAAKLPSQYTEKDIEQIRTIHNLVKVRGFKIAAARKMLNKNRAGVDKSSDILATLISVRDELKELKRRLDSLV